MEAIRKTWSLYPSGQARHCGLDAQRDRRPNCRSNMPSRRASPGSRPEPDGKLRL